jgi:hypothetical protein
VWRAANGINPQDPRPTGGAQLETLPTLWKQRLDRTSHVPPTRQRMPGPTSDKQHTPHLDAGATTGSALPRPPNGVRAGRARPADSTPSIARSQQSEHGVPLHAATAGQAERAAHCRRWRFFQIKRARCARRRLRSVSSLASARCGPILALSGSARGMARSR